MNSHDTNLKQCTKLYTGMKCSNISKLSAEKTLVANIGHSILGVTVINKARRIFVH